MLALGVSIFLLFLSSTAVAKKPPDNACGNKSGDTCNPKSLKKGLCCSSAGFCGNDVIHCGAGCQPQYGACNVAGVGRFNHYASTTFTGSVLPNWLIASDNTVQDTSSNPNALYDHTFVPSNVAVSGGYLNLKVPGGQTSGPIRSAEVATSISNILYASVRVNAILTSEPGVVDGIFFYHNDCQETDIEYVSDPKSLSNPGSGQKPPLQYTNQATDCNTDHATHTTVPAPANVDSTSHEYRIDWTAGKVVFYTDGVVKKTFTTNVPDQASSFILNIWSNGDPGFTVGPPTKDAIFKIRSITMYYNTTSS